MGCTDMVVGHYFGVRSLCRSSTNSYVVNHEQFFEMTIFLRGVGHKNSKLFPRGVCKKEELVQGWCIPNDTISDFVNKLLLQT